MFGRKKNHDSRYWRWKMAQRELERQRILGTATDAAEGDGRGWAMWEWMWLELGGRDVRTRFLRVRYTWCKDKALQIMTVYTCANLQGSVASINKEY